MTPRLNNLFGWYSTAIGIVAAMSMPLLITTGLIGMSTLDRINAIPAAGRYAGAFVVIFILSAGLGLAFAALHLRVERLLGFNK